MELLKPWRFLKSTVDAVLTASPQALGKGHILGKIVHWPRHEGNVTYRATFRRAMNGEQIGVLSDLHEPRCELPPAWGELGVDAVVRIEIFSVRGGDSAEWSTWLPFFQLTPPAPSGLTIASPEDSKGFPQRLRVRSVEGDTVLLDLVLCANQFPLPDHLAQVGWVRYKFLRFDHEARKWVDV